MLFDKEGKYYYPYATGMKTGTTDKAGRSLIASAEKDGKTVIVIGLGCRTDEQRYKFAIQMFENALRANPSLWGEKSPGTGMTLRAGYGVDVLRSKY